MDDSFLSGSRAEFRDPSTGYWLPKHKLNQSTISSLSRASRMSSGGTMQSRRGSDLIPSRPTKRLFTRSSQENVQPAIKRVLSKNIKGVGFVKPGDPFANKPQVLKHEFAFDMASLLGLRSVCATFWRHGYSDYLDEDINILSPALMTINRTVDSVDISTGIRNATPSPSIPYDEQNPPFSLYSSTSLWDLEIASWNANGMKLLLPSASTPGPAPNPNAMPNQAVPVVSSLIVYRDYIGQADHIRGTPFPNANQAPVAYGSPADSQRAPFMVNLGSGSVSFNCQNKLPTNAEVEFVVYQIRDVQTNFSDDATQGFLEYQCLYSSETSMARTLGPKLTHEVSGSGGKPIAEYDCVNNPNYKLLAVYPKYQQGPSPLIEKDRLKFVLQGGSFKSVTFDLPAQVYDSQKNRLVSGDPFAEDPSASSISNLQTYIIVVAVNGVVMPAFTYPLTNDTNGINAVDHNNNSIVDRRHCASSVLFTGVYTEHPMPCLPTPVVNVYNNYPLMQETTVEDDLFGLTSGLVAQMPVSVAHGNTVVFAGIGSAATKADSND